VKAYRVWSVLAAAVMSLLLGCHGGGEQEALFGAPGLGADIIGVWELCAIGPSFDGPWYSAEETGSSGTWNIREAGEPIRSLQVDAESGEWSRTLSLPNRPVENSTGTWGCDLRTGYYFSDGSGATAFYLHNNKLYYAIQEPGTFTGAVVWEKK
jgi:hypothetical protein